MKKPRGNATQEPPAERPARGRKPIFRREHVLEAALAVVDQNGHEALSMRAIAAHLKTGVATLYHYFGSLAEVRDAMAIELLREIPLLDATSAAEVRQQLKATALAYANVAARYPDFELMLGAQADQHVMRLLDSALRAMVNAGVDIERAGVSWAVLQSLAQSHALSSRRLNSARHRDAAKRFQGLDAVLSLAETGAFKASHDEWFHHVLDLTLDRMLPELKSKSSGR